MSSNIKVQRVCQHCGCEFTAQTTTTRYCSHKCNSAAYKARKREEKVEASTPTKKVTEMNALDFLDLQGKEYLKVKEAASLLRCSVRTMYRLIDDGKLRAFNLGERMTRIKRADIECLKLEKLLYEEITALDISDCYTITEVQYKFGISSKALLDIIKRNRIPRIQQGKFVYVPKERIDKIFQ